MDCENKILDPRKKTILHRVVILNIINAQVQFTANNFSLITSSITKKTSAQFALNLTRSCLR